MNIDITKEPDDLKGELENCIFCNAPTPYWNEESNRPVCPVCAVYNTFNDIDKAKFNY